ncbi:hypothetical protein JTE90_001064 [Oedothorax gibbosus]|uniref:THAP-type domain-containing protein n=1 Tax=Oedothorax gibbosus TaxID=931172 RepID=A0AAV6TJE4_9ARAC|nr:hypothetical protein JTE90_001064 [Oedothorax gibbosus]
MRGNTNLLSKISMFSFPTNVSRRAEWARAIRREGWSPKPKSRICSKHFVEGKPSNNPDHPDWNPSIFPFEKENKRFNENKMARFRRVQDRRTAVLLPLPVGPLPQLSSALLPEPILSLPLMMSQNLPLGLSAYQQMCQAATMMIS